MAVLTDVAAAVLARLEAASLSLPFVAARGYVIVSDAAALDDLTLSVVAPRVTLTPYDLKHRYAWDPVVSVVVRQRVPDAETATLDPLAAFVQEVADLFIGWQVTDLHGRCTQVDVDPAYDPAMLDEQRVFSSTVSLTFRFTR